MLQKIYRFLCKLEVALCGAGFILLILLILLSAGLRFFRFSMAWNIDMALFLLAWTAFLGADIAWREGKLFGIDILTRRFPSVLQKIVQLLMLGIILCGLVIIIVYGTQLAWLERLRRYQSIPVPYSFALLSLLTAALSMALSTILKIRLCIISFKDDGKKEAAV